MDSYQQEMKYVCNLGKVPLCHTILIAKENNDKFKYYTPPTTGNVAVREENYNLYQIIKVVFYPDKIARLQEVGVGLSKGELDVGTREKIPSMYLAKEYNY